MIICEREGVSQVEASITDSQVVAEAGGHSVQTMATTYAHLDRRWDQMRTQLIGVRRSE